MAEPVIVSYSELDTYRQCPLKHFLAYKLRYKKPPKPDGALAKGSLYHAVMEVLLKEIKTWQDQHGGKVSEREEPKLLKRITDKHVMPMLWDAKRGEWFSDIHELIFWMYEGYIENYGTHQDWRILGVEHQIVTPLRDAKGRRSRYHLKAKIDLLVRDRTNGGIWVVDHKSGQNLPSQMDLEIDDQFGLYTWAMREVGKKVLGSIHNANRTQRNKGPMLLTQRMSQTYLNRSETEITSLALDAYNVAVNAYPPASKVLPTYSSPDPRTCGWKCDFKEPHLLMRKGRKMQEVLHEYGFVIDKTRH